MSEPKTGQRLAIFVALSAVLGGVLTYLITRQPAPAVVDPAPPETEAQKAQTPKGSFRFYDLLVETEVEIEVEADPKREVDTRQRFLQVASFKDADDAEQARVQLLLLNFEPMLETSSNGWHRLIVGPFPNARDMFKAQDVLVKNGFQFLELRR